MAFMTRTPLRVSLFGGGTDYPEYYQRNPGAVVGMAIQQYIYITALRLRAHLNYAYRLSYSKLEFTDRIEAIEHPVVRETLLMYGIRDHLDMSVMSDFAAAGCGLGSSSAFTVGFVNLISTMLAKPMTKMDLARTAMSIERDILGENVGVQDQLHAAFGGINRFDFDGARFKVSPVQVRGETMAAIDSSLVLINTGVSRRATNVAAEQRSLTKTSGLDKNLGELYTMVGEAVDVLESGASDVLPELGRRLVESWKIKRQLTGSVTNDLIDNIYQTAMDVGAYGGKLCGAGGGGYIMMLVPPEQIPKLAERLQHLAVIPTCIDVAGAMVLSRGHNDQLQPLNTGPATLPGRSGGANDNNTVNAQDLSNLSLLRAYRPPQRAS